MSLTLSLIRVMSFAALVRHTVRMGAVEDNASETCAVAASLLFDAYRVSDTALCLVTRTGQLIHANDLCRAHWADGPKGFLVRDGVIVARALQAREQFRSALTKNRRSIVLSGDGGDDERVWVALVQPIRNTDYVLVSFRPSLRPPIWIFAPIADHFALSPQQARVALELVSGRTVDQIARKLGVTIETIRSHLKAIYDKTGARSQAGVVAKALRFLRP